MKKSNFLAVLCILCSLIASAQPGRYIPEIKESKLPASKVDFDAFDSLTNEVKEYRKDRLINLDKFRTWSTEKNTIILDTRSTEMYNRKHVKGAVHLDFTDFTQDNLQRVIPATTTRILIYCNNNFSDDQLYFATKYARPKLTGQKPITLALNIPTFINLYGYGYKNVYELADLVSVLDPGIQFEGTDLKRAVVVPRATTPMTQSSVKR